MRLVARKAYRDLLATEQIDGTSAVVCGLHDERERQIIWVLDTGSSERHQDALPASTATYSTVLIHQYDTDEAWLEDHPDIVGGGMMTNHHASIGSDVQQLLVFRPDGSLLEFRGRTTAKDADVTDPENGTADTVNAQVETGWLDFGTLERKTLTRIDLILRRSRHTTRIGIATATCRPATTGSTCQVYTDYDESTVRYTQGRVYDSTATRLTQYGENRQAVSFRCCCRRASTGACSSCASRTRLPLRRRVPGTSSPVPHQRHILRSHRHREHRSADRTRRGRDYGVNLCGLG